MRTGAIHSLAICHVVALLATAHRTRSSGTTISCRAASKRPCLLEAFARLSSKSTNPPLTCTSRQATRVATRPRRNTLAPFSGFAMTTAPLAFNDPLCGSFLGPTARRPTPPPTNFRAVAPRPVLFARLSAFHHARLLLAIQLPLGQDRRPRDLAFATAPSGSVSADRSSGGRRPPPPFEAFPMDRRCLFPPRCGVSWPTPFPCRPNALRPRRGGSRGISRSISTLWRLPRWFPPDLSPRCAEAGFLDDAWVWRAHLR